MARQARWIKERREKVDCVVNPSLPHLCLRDNRQLGFYTARAFSGIMQLNSSLIVDEKLYTADRNLGLASMIQSYQAAQVRWSGRLTKSTASGIWSPHLPYITGSPSRSCLC